jgi:hypothetical protein
MALFCAGCMSQLNQFKWRMQVADYIAFIRFFYVDIEPCWLVPNRPRGALAPSLVQRAETLPQLE